MFIMPSAWNRGERLRTISNLTVTPGVTPIYALTRVHPALQFLWNILGVGKAYAYGRPVMANPNGIGFAYATPGGRRPSRNRTVRRRAPWAPHILQERLRVTEPRRDR